MLMHNQLWESLTRDQQRQVLKVFGHDGHSIYPASYLAEHGVPQEVIEVFAETHESDGTLKGSIERGGVPVDSMAGVYGLTVLHSLAAYHHVTTDKMGRGFQASDLTNKLERKLRASR